MRPNQKFRAEPDEDTSAVPSTFALTPMAFALPSGLNTVYFGGRGASSVANVGKTFQYTSIDDYSQLQLVIDGSRSILELPGNFDGEGALPYSAATWKRAVDFLEAQWRAFRKRTGHIMVLPDIGPGPEGSIDLYWYTDEFRLLVNIPGEAKEQVTVSGNSNGSKKIEYSFDPSKLSLRLLDWLAERVPYSTTK
jgi:hypothetical protein